MLNDDRTVLYIRLNTVYDKYTKYRKDFSITGEFLPYKETELASSELRKIAYLHKFVKELLLKSAGSGNNIPGHDR